jgi:hypothetical protein
MGLAGQWRLVIAVAALGAVGIGCDWLHDRFKTCHDVLVTVSNSEQTIDPIAIAGPGEDFTQRSVLASGEARQITICMERGDREEFRASLDGRVIKVANCVLTRFPEEGLSVRVVWTLQGFRCEGWD